MKISNLLLAIIFFMDKLSDNYKYGLTEQQLKALMSKNCVDHVLCDLARGQQISISFDPTKDVGTGIVEAMYFLEDKIKSLKISTNKIKTIRFFLEPTGEDDKIHVRAELGLKIERSRHDEKDVALMYYTLNNSEMLTLLNKLTNAKGTIIHYDNGDIDSHD